MHETKQPAYRHHYLLRNQNERGQPGNYNTLIYFSQGHIYNEYYIIKNLFILENSFI